MHKSRPARARRLLLLVSMTATAVTFLAPAAEAAPTVITVSKTASPAEGGSITPGATITYSILISNGAGDVATGVSLTDATPANTAYVANSASINGGPPIAGATNPFADGEPIPDIPASGSATATFQVTVSSPLANGTTITNTADVSATNADPASDLSDDAVHTVASAPSLIVTKTSTPAESGTVNPGDTITYSVVVANQASATDSALGVSLTDATPANTTYVAGSATLDGNPVPDNAGPPLNPFEDGEALGDMAPNTSHTAAFRVLVSTPLPNNTPISNTATANASNNPNVSDGANHTVTSTPGLTVDKTADPAEGGPVTPGATLTYTIAVANDLAATETATGVVLTDDTPAGTTYVAGSATIDDGTTIDPATNPFVTPGLSIDDLDPAETTTATFQVTVDAPADNGTSIANTATVSSDQGPDIANDATHTVQSAPTLTMAKTSVPVEGGKVTPGTVIGYSMAITNDTAATEKAKQVTLTDPTPANTTYVEGSAKIDGAPISGAGNPLAAGYAVRDLPPGDTATISFEVKVASPLAKGTVISNLAKLTAENHPDVEDGASHTVDSAAVLKVTLSSDPKAGSKVKAGDKIAYGLVVSNDAAATDSLQNVVVTAPTPDGTNYVEGSAKVGGTPSQSSSRLAAPDSNPFSSGSSLGNLAPGATRTLDWAVEVRSSAGAIEGTVTVTASGMTAVTATTSHRGPNAGSGGGDGGGGGGGGGNDDDGAAFGPSSGGVASGAGSDELAFTGLDLARLLTLALSLFLVGWTLMARGRDMRRRAATVPAEYTRVSGFPAWDRWAGAWFFPDKK